MKKKLAAVCIAVVVLLSLTVSLTACSFDDNPTIYLTDILISANQTRSYNVDFVQIYYKVDGTNYFIYEKHPTQENGRSIEFLNRFTELQIPDLEIDLPQNTNFTLYIAISIYNAVTGSNTFFVESTNNTDDIITKTYLEQKIETNNVETFDLKYTISKK